MTDWRTLGDISPETWTAQLASVGSPLTTVAVSCYRAAQPHTAMCLALLERESSYAKRFRFNVESNYNPCNLRPPGGDGYLRFSGWTEGIRAWRERITDPTYKDGIYARTRTIAELIHVYAPDSDGHNNEAAYVAGINASLLRWGVTPQEVQPMSTITFGKVPYPEFVESHLPASNPYVQESGAPDIPEAVFWHRMIGSLIGTNGWFHSGNAATAYGVGVAATDGPFQAGRIYEWIAPRNGWYGESSGPVKVPYGDGLAFVNEVGTANVNRLSKAIEISGDVDTPLDEKARQSIAAMTAYWADQKGIPWNEFPHYRAKNRSYVIWHNEVTGMAYKTCPGAVVMAETPALIERTKQIMKQYQEGATVPEKPQYATPLPITWKAGDLGWKKLGDVSVYCLEAEVEVVRATTPLEYADGDDSDGEKADPAGPKIKQGERVKVIGSFANLNEKGQTVRWLIRASDNARIIGSSCRPLLPVKQ